jgi:tetratricopeptide (TPR) repeat protein
MNDGCTTNYVENDCIYGDVLRKLIGLREDFDLPVENTFLFDVVLVLLEWSIRRGDHHHAEALVTTLLSHLHPRIGNYREVSTDVLSLQALLLSRQGRHEDAIHLMRTVIKKSKVGCETALTGRLLLLLTLIQLDSSKHEFTRVLPSVMECLTLAEEHGMDGLHAAALSLLAQVHLRMEKPRRAAAVLQAVLPSLLQQEHVWLQGEAYLTLGKCLLKQATKDGVKSNAQQTLTLAAHELTRSKELFLRCQDSNRLKEVYYLLARIYNELPNSRGQRDEASENFLKMQQRTAQSSSSSTADLISSLTDKHQLGCLAVRTLVE